MGNLQVSAGVYFTGSSFTQLEKVSLKLYVYMYRDVTIIYFLGTIIVREIMVLQLSRLPAFIYSQHH